MNPSRLAPHWSVHGPLNSCRIMPLWEWILLWDELAWCNLMFYISPNWLLGPWDRLVCGLAAFQLRISLGHNQPWVTPEWRSLSHFEAIRSPPNLRSQSDHPSLTASSHESRKVSIWMPKEGLWTSSKSGGPGIHGGRFFFVHFFWITLIWVSK